MEEEEKESKTLQKAKEDFDAFRKAYPGTKRGLTTEFENFKRKHTKKSDLRFFPRFVFTH